MIAPDKLLEKAREGVKLAERAGADEAEVFADAVHALRAELRAGDVHGTVDEEETTFGIRVFKDGSEGFATVNDGSELEAAAVEAVTMARATPPDPHNGLADPQPVEPLPDGPDAAITGLDVGDLVDLAGEVLSQVRAVDERIRIDSGSVSAETSLRAVATSTGIELVETRARAGGSLFGMAVDGDDVGSFDHDGHVVRTLADLRPELTAMVQRFAIKTLGALGAGKGESFRGPVVLSPEVVRSFLLENLLGVLGARAVRTGRSPFAGRLGEAIVSESLTLTDDGRLPGAAGSSSFDREGTPRRRTPIIAAGRLKSFLSNHYEARRNGGASTGHASGSAAMQPVIGPTNLILESGGTPFSTLCAEGHRTVLVSRFSGSCNPTTGEFSGVVKGGFLIVEGDRRPIRETMISGNLFEILRRVSGVSIETRNIGGRDRIPALRIEDVSITAG